MVDGAIKSYIYFNKFNVSLSACLFTIQFLQSFLTKLYQIWYETSIWIQQECRVCKSSRDPSKMDTTRMARGYRWVTKCCFMDLGRPTSGWRCMQTIGGYMPVESKKRCKAPNFYLGMKKNNCVFHKRSILQRLLSLCWERDRREGARKCITVKS